MTVSFWQFFWKPTLHEKPTVNAYCRTNGVSWSKGERAGVLWRAGLQATTSQRCGWLPAGLSLHHPVILNFAAPGLPKRHDHLCAMFSSNVCHCLAHTELVWIAHAWISCVTDSLISLPKVTPLLYWIRPGISSQLANEYPPFSLPWWLELQSQRSQVRGQFIRVTLCRRLQVRKIRSSFGRESLELTDMSLSRNLLQLFSSSM